jgi:hypothetical protein
MHAAYRPRFAVLALLLLVMRPATAQFPEPPESPGPEAWPFLRDLAAPIQWRFHWTREAAASDEVSLRGGIRVEATFPDPDGVLETAYQDLDTFFAAASIPRDGAYRIVTEQVPTETFEAFRITIAETECRIQATIPKGSGAVSSIWKMSFSVRKGPFSSPA